MKTNNNKKLSSGHSACSGCGQLTAVQAVLRGLDSDTIITNATGCLEVTTTAYPTTAWGLPWIHSLFENASSVASGIRAGLNYKKNKTTRVVAFGGDGATFDIGTGLISGMWERGDDVLYICFDTESYSNTGYQASGATPYGANTATSPVSDCEILIPQCPFEIGSKQNKKDMIAIALAHHLNYVAQSTAGFIDDITAKVKKAMAIKGPAYIQILSPCVPGWKIKENEAVKIGKLAANCGLYPLLEYTNGQLTSQFKLPKPTPKVEEYLKLQGRFSHLFKNENYKKEVGYLQQIADENIKKYNC
jgi:pyruvate ferredoxin oxidoreductase beta subunit